MKIKPDYTMTLKPGDVEAIIRHYIEEYTGMGKIQSISFNTFTKYSSDPRDNGYEVFGGATIKYEPTLDLLQK